MISATISRDGDDLTATGNPSAGTFYLPEENVRFPRLSLRKVYAPESEFIEGRVKLAQVPGVTDYELPICAHADTTADLFDAMDELEAACAQFMFTLTLTIDGVSRAYRAEADYPNWGEVDSGMVRAHIVRGTVSFVLHPGVVV